MLRILATTTVGAALFALLVGFMVGWASVLTHFSVSLIYSTVIGASSALILPSVAHRLAARSPVVRWLGIAASLVAIAVPRYLGAGSIAHVVGRVAIGTVCAA